jgi:predicted DCC family thiol-disulfide oxidoreductase YuxK
VDGRSNSASLAAAPIETWEFKLLYDGECPRWLQRRNRKGLLAFEDVSAPGFDAAQYGTTRENLLGVIHGVLPDRILVRRVEVFRRAYRPVGLGWLLAPTDWPVLRGCCDALHAVFARHRVRIGRLFGRKCTSGKCSATPNRKVIE